MNATEATTHHDGGPAGDGQMRDYDLYATNADGSPVHDRHSVAALHAQAVKDGRHGDAQMLHRHLERRFGGGGGHDGQPNGGY